MRRAALLVALFAGLPAASAAADSVRATYSNGRCAAHAVRAPASGSIPIPRLTGRVVDDAGILSPKVRGLLAARLARLEAKTSDQLVVLTVKDLRGQSIEAYGMAVGNGWGIGRKGLDNGVLLIVAPNDHKVRIEIGCGLEGLLTPLRAETIVREALLPLLKQRHYDDAAQTGVGRIAAVLESDLRRSRPAKEMTR